MVTHIYDDGIGSIELLDHMSTDIDIVDAARACVGATAGTEMTGADIKTLRYMFRNKHTSPFEHTCLKFRVKVPLFVARQHMRHRTWSYNELSMRFAKSALEFYTPKAFRTQATKNLQCSNDDEINPTVDFLELPKPALVWLKIYYGLVGSLYSAFIKAGIARELARIILPMGTYTTYVATVDLHNFLHFLRLRDSSHAQPEMRKMAQAMKVEVAKYFPITIQLFDEI